MSNKEYHDLIRYESVTDRLYRGCLLALAAFACYSLALLISFH